MPETPPGERLLNFRESQGGFCSRTKFQMRERAFVSFGTCLTDLPHRWKFEQVLQKQFDALLFRFLARTIFSACIFFRISRIFPSFRIVEATKTTLVLLWQKVNASTSYDFSNLRIDIHTRDRVDAITQLITGAITTYVTRIKKKKEGERFAPATINDNYLTEICNWNHLRERGKRQADLPTEGTTLILNRRRVWSSMYKILGEEQQLVVVKVTINLRSRKITKERIFVDVLSISFRKKKKERNTNSLETSRDLF